MSADKYGVQNGPLGQHIQVGRLSKDGTRFLDWEDHTDLVLSVVGEYVRKHYGGGMEATFPGMGFDLRVTVTPRDEDVTP